ncbi:hypothetical protein AB751O23_AQ_00050 [Chlamydiales bacterium SCGC AB-751-O23]|jgi:2-polyprenyl-6-methoxyphenol hydroxylase-like FAD-dependent oxidoreductase|nr:hypothetical protein AB751O23_AQ_00050 [Chlamydiales bacterium SCGC AB-751-O23]
MSIKAIPLKTLPTSLPWYTSARNTFQKNKKPLTLACIAVVFGASLALRSYAKRSNGKLQAGAPPFVLPRKAKISLDPLIPRRSANAITPPSRGLPASASLTQPRNRRSVDPVPLSESTKEKILKVLKASKLPSPPLVQHIPENLPGLQRFAGTRAYHIDSIPPVTSNTPGYQTLLQLHPHESAALLNTSEYLFNSQIGFFKSITDHLNSPTVPGKALIDSLKGERLKNLAKIPSGQKPLDILIVGQGIGGLFSALEAYKSGANVIRLEAREEMTRDQILRLDIDSQIYLRENFGFLLDVAQRWGLIKEEETNIDTDILSSRFLSVETKNLEFITDSILVALELSESSGIVSLQGSFLGFTEPTREGEKWTSEILLKSKGIKGVRSVKVDYIVGADGANSRVRESSGISWSPISNTSNSGVITFPNLFRNNLDSSHLFSVPQVVLDGANEDLEAPLALHACRGPIASTRLHEQVLTTPNKLINSRRVEDSLYTGARLEQVPIRTVELDLVKKGLKPYLDALKTLSWELERTPINRLFISAHTIYLGTDVPEETFEEMQRENRKSIDERPIQMRYFRKVLESNFPRYLIDFLMPYAKSSFVFKSQLFRASRAYREITVENKSPLKVFILGDANSTPQFQTGSGAFKAFSDALDFGRFLRNSLDRPRFKIASLNLYQLNVGERSNYFAKKAFDLGVLEE